MHTRSAMGTATHHHLSGAADIDREGAANRMCMRAPLHRRTGASKRRGARFQQTSSILTQPWTTAADTAPPTGDTYGSTDTNACRYAQQLHRTRLAARQSKNRARQRHWVLGLGACSRLHVRCCGAEPACSVVAAD